MQVRLLAFAQSADQAGFRQVVIDASPEETPRQIVSRAAPALPLSGLRVAVDCEYGDWDSPVGEATEIALIPPVSGG